MTPSTGAKVTVSGSLSVPLVMRGGRGVAVARPRARGQFDFAMAPRERRGLASAFKGFFKPRNRAAPAEEARHPAPDLGVLAHAQVREAPGAGQPQRAPLTAAQHRAWGHACSALPAVESAQGEDVLYARTLVVNITRTESELIAAGHPEATVQLLLSRVAADPAIAAAGGVREGALVFGAKLRELQSRLGEGRMGVVKAALMLALPAMPDSPATQQLVAQLVALDRLFATDASGRPRAGYDFGRLLAALCNRARIRELGGSPGGMEKAVAGLTALAATVADALGDGRDEHAIADGYELNALVGLDNDLDTVVAEVRKECVARCMGGAGEAGELVKLEGELARARIRLVHALDRAGVPRPVEVLLGVKMDATLLRALTQKLGPRAREVGLALMAVYLAQRHVEDCAGAARLRGLISHELDRRSALVAEGLRAPLADAEAQRAVAAEGQVHHGEIRRLQARLASLQPAGRREPEARFGLDAVTVAALGIPDDMLRGPDELARRGDDSGAAALRRHNAVCGAELMERKGLASTGEVAAALSAVHDVAQPWLARGGPEALRKEGVLDMLKTVRQEDRAVAFGERLRDKPGRSDLEAVRAAMLHQITVAKGERPVTPHVHDVPIAADAVRATLQDWGVEGPGLDELIARESHGGLTVEKLGVWAKDAALPELEAPPLDAGDALVQSLAAPRIGTRFKVVTQKQLQVNTGTWAVEPTLTVGVGARASAGGLASIEVVRPVDAYEIVLATGTEFKAAADVSATPFGTKAFGVKAGAFGNVEAGGQRLAGVTLRHATPASLQATLKRVIEAGGEVDYMDLADVDDIMLLRQRRAGAEASMGVVGAFNPGAAEFGWGAAAPAGATVTAGVRAGAGGGVQGGRLQAGGTRGAVVKTDRDTFAKTSATAAVGGQLDMHVGDSHRAGVPVAEAGVSASHLVRTKTKQVYGDDGQVKPGTERFRQGPVAGADPMKVAEKLGGPAFVELMKLLKLEAPAAHQAIVAMLADIRPNEMFSVLSQIDPAVARRASRFRVLANTFRMRQAGALTPARADAAAEYLERIADKLVANPDHYNIVHVGTVSPDERTETDVSVNLGVLQHKTVTSTTAEAFPRDQRIGANPEQLEMARRAREAALRRK